MEDHNGIQSLPLPNAEPPEGLWPELVVNGWERAHNHAVSPDGTRVAFYWDRNGYSDLWLVNTDGCGFPQRLTFNRPFVNWWEDEPPVWSPDGKWLLYGCYTDEVSNLHLVSAEGGKPRALTELHADAAEPAFSPDGQRIAFCTYKDGATQLAVVPAEGGWVFGLTHGDLECSSPAWSPDGNQIVYHAAPQHLTKQAGVFVIASTGSEPVRLTPTDGAEYWAPSYSPDGRWIALLSNRSGYDELWLMAPDGSHLHQLSRLQQDIEDYAWSSDGRRLAAISSAQGNDHLWVIETESGTTHPVSASSGNYTMPRWIPGCDGFVVGYDSADTPPELRVFDLSARAGGKQKTLFSACAPALRRYPFITPRYVEYTSFDGWMIPSFLYWPAAPPADRRGYPAIVYPHGGPTAEYDLHWDPVRQYFVAKGYVVLCPNYRGSTGYGRLFKEANLFDWGGGDLKDCLYGADRLADESLIDRRRIAIWGQSYGAYLAQLALCKDPEYRFRCAVALYGDSHLKTSWALGDHSGRQDVEWQMGAPGPNQARYEAASPLNFVERIRAPLLLLHGERDARVHVHESRQMAEALKRANKTFEYKTYPDEGHGFAQPANALDALLRIERFLDWHLL
ncbi:MAG: S9 family peptidase [Anaerolineae bacterium]|nr:S9 family peptidase [Thermoflexales bacterium]MDW8407605.1 S9 family peptidase [Anaerolineae bacterium]